MTVKRRLYRKIFGKSYPGGWNDLKPGLKEKISVAGYTQTLIVSPDGSSICLVPPDGEDVIIDMIREGDLNQLQRSLRYSVLYTLDKDGFEDKKFDLNWEPTLPGQAKK
jgi:hypothetical protein